MKEALVKSILEARRAQKLARNQFSQDEEQIEQNIARLQGPVTQQLKDIGKDTVSAISSFTQPQQLLPPIDQTAAGVPKQRQQWVLQLYKKYRNQKQSRTTTFEIDVKDGRLGKLGKVDVEKLFNENILHIDVHDKRSGTIHNLTVGLAALVLLPHDDLDWDAIVITKGDINRYKEIMDHVEYSARTTASRKRQLLKSQTDENDDVFHDPTAVVGSGMGKRRRQSCEKKYYSSHRELEARLNVLAGSRHAGNTSVKILREMREIVDILYTDVPHIHSRLYQKFNLL